MKKITIICAALAAITLASCKKDRTCECTTSSTEPGYTGVTMKTTLIDASGKQARANCLSTSQEYEESGTKYVETRTCTLK